MDVLALREETSFLMLDTPLARELEENLDELSRLALRVALGVLRNREDAEEVAQEAMLTVCRKWRTLRKPDRLRPWLVRITWRLAIDRRRAEGRREKRELGALDPTPPASPEDVLSSRELKEYIWRAIDELPEKHRKTLILSAIEGHDTRSVSRLLNVPVGTVKSRLHQARTKLLERLKWIATETEGR